MQSRNVVSILHFVFVNPPKIKVVFRYVWSKYRGAACVKPRCYPAKQVRLNKIWVSLLVSMVILFMSPYILCLKITYGKTAVRNSRSYLIYANETKWVYINPVCKGVGLKGNWISDMQDRCSVLTNWVTNALLRWGWSPTSLH